MHAQLDVFPQLAALIDSLRAEDPSLLVFSAGDNRTGNPVNDKYRIPAYPMVALMNLTGFNGSALGNHEFDVHSLSRLIGLSSFRYICANIFPDDTTNIKTLTANTAGDTISISGDPITFAAGATITLGTILGYSAMAGTVAGGGLGDIAIQYGYYRWKTDIMLITVAILVVLFQIFQMVGMKIASALDHRK